MKFYYVIEKTTGKFVPNRSWGWGIHWLNSPDKEDHKSGKEELLCNTPRLYQSRKILEDNLKAIKHTRGLEFEIMEVSLGYDERR